MAIDVHLPVALPYEAPALERIGEFVDFAAELEKLGASGTFAYVPGDPIDWSHGRVS